MGSETNKIVLFPSPDASSRAEVEIHILALASFFLYIMGNHRTNHAHPSRSVVVKPGSLKLLILVLVLVVLLPALFFSVYEVSALHSSEELTAQVYRRQLDVVLFSVNQYAWDVANSWAGSTARIAAESHGAPGDTAMRNGLNRFMTGKSSVKAIFLTDSLGRIDAVFPNPQGRQTLDTNAVAKSVSANREKLARLLRFQRQDYRKVEPITIGRSDDPAGIALVFAGDAASSGSILAIVLDEERFVRDILSPRMTETAGNDFVLAVFGSRGLQFTTAPFDTSEIREKKGLWIFPTSIVAVKLKGTTVEDLARSRFRRNIVLIGLLDLVLAAGAWFVYRSVRREMEYVRLRSDFVSNVSHELRTPLALIRMYAETLTMDRLKNEEKKKEYYSTILQETERLTRLVNNMLDFARMDAGRKRYRMQRVFLNDVVSRVLAAYGEHLRAEGFQPIVETSPGLPEIDADPEAVAEAIINILDNAAKYNGPERFLRIATGSDQAGVYVEVQDHGIGIAPEHREKIFETFYRINTGLVHNTKGSGLGLALVKHIMDAHGGTIIVDSTPGTGSTFRLHFPTRPASV